MDDQCHHCIGFRRDHRFGAFEIEPVFLARKIGIGLGFDQFRKWCVRPVALGDVVMRGGQRTDPPADDIHEGPNILRIVFRLVDQAANEVEDIANAVVEFRDQQFLLFLCFCPFGDRLVGQPQDDFEQRHPQTFGYLEFGLRPFLRATFDRFLPGFETLSRSQTIAMRAGFHGLFRISGPGHRLRQRFAPQDEIVARRARYRDDQSPGRAFGEPCGPRQPLGDRVARQQSTGGSAIQAGDDRAELFLVRRRSARIVNVLHEDADPVMRDDLLDHRFDHRQACRQGGARRDVAHQPRMDFAPHFAPLRNLPRQCAVQHQRKQLGKQLCGSALRIRQQLGAVMMAGEQTPKLPADDDRDRQRCAHAHIFEILDVDRRYGPQRTHAEIERLTVEGHAGVDRDGFGIDIGDDAKAIAQIERARLIGDVRFGVAQAVEFLEILARRLGDDFAGQVLAKTVHHDPVDLQGMSQLPGRFVGKIPHIGVFFQPRHDRAEQGELAIEIVFRVRLHFDDRIGPRTVQGAVIQGFVIEKVDAEQAFDLILARQRGSGTAKLLQRRTGEQ